MEFCHQVGVSIRVSLTPDPEGQEHVKSKAARGSSHWIGSWTWVQALGTRQGLVMAWLRLLVGMVTQLWGQKLRKLEPCRPWAEPPEHGSQSYQRCAAEGQREGTLGQLCYSTRWVILGKPFLNFGFSSGTSLVMPALQY